MSPDWSKTPEGVPYADLGNPQSLNLYGYLKNNPTSHVDVDGHGELWDKFKSMFYVKVNAGAGVGGEVKLTKAVKAGGELKLSVDHKLSNGGSTTTASAEASGGLKAGTVNAAGKLSVESQLTKDGKVDLTKPEVKVTLPSINGEAGGAKGEATPNEVSVSGHYNAFGGEVGIDVDKAREFGQAVSQNLSDAASFVRDKFIPNVQEPGPSSDFVTPRP